MFKTGQSTKRKNYFNERKDKSTDDACSTWKVIVPGGLAPPLSALAPPRWTADWSVFGSQITDPPRTEKSFSTCSKPTDRSIGPRLCPRTVCYSCPTGVNRETDSPRSGLLDLNRP
jgi:hypothetical protein